MAELPSDFSSDEYRLLNIDLERFTKNQLERHYLNYGKFENRLYKITDHEYTITHLQSDRSSFHFRNYLRKNPTLITKMKQKKITQLETKMMLWNHWCTTGRHQKTTTKVQKRNDEEKNQCLINSNKDENSEKKNHSLELSNSRNPSTCVVEDEVLEQFPELFHKVVVQLVSKTDVPDIQFLLIKNITEPSFIHNKLWCHIHCFNLNCFHEMFDEYIDVIKSVFSVVVTYTLPSEEIIDKFDFIFLQVENKGCDIGGKLVAVTFLEQKNIMYDYCFFLHSKPNLKRRKEYFDPFIRNKTQILYLVSKLYTYDLITHDLNHDGDWNMKEGYTINKIYVEQYTKWLGFRFLTNVNNEGNCFVASKNLINHVFPIDARNIIYNCMLNSNDYSSFDYNWVSTYYRCTDLSVSNVYKKFQQNKWVPNHLAVRKIFDENLNEKLPVITNYSEILDPSFVLKNKYSLQDGGIEHLFERLWVNIALNLNMQQYIMVPLEDVQLKYDFDFLLYRSFQKQKTTQNSIENINKIKSSINLTADNTKHGYLYSLEQILRKIPSSFRINKNENLYDKIWSFVESNNFRDVENSWYSLMNFQPENKPMHIFENAKSKKSKKEEFTQFRVYAYLFPQFHEIPENNEFWGNGFTDWENVKKTKQIHSEHIPLTPHKDFGYYNLLSQNHRLRLTCFLNDYEIDGLVICFYWFSKGMIMNGLFDKMLQDNQPDCPWFLNWINENWTRRWDGGNDEVLLAIDAKSSQQADLQFYAMLPYFHHKNYKKINNYILLGIYRTEDVSVLYIERLNELAKRNGFAGIKFIKSLNNNVSNNRSIAEEVTQEQFEKSYWEYEMEYPPNYSGTMVDARVPNTLFTYYVPQNKSYNYDIRLHYQALSKTQPKSEKQLIRGIMPMWDNFPRHHSCRSYCHIQLGANSLLFFFYMVKMFLNMKRDATQSPWKNSEFNFCVINALNEWGEQCVLEPTMQTDYSFPLAIKFAKNLNFSKVNETCLDTLL